jgi:pyruvate, orthophosphate dikinase
VAGKVVREGDWISLNGSTGEVYVGQIPTKPSEVLQVLLEKTLAPEQSETYAIYATIMSWADEVRTLKIRTNADQPDQAANAVAFGAEGIGLCRTEHMFFEGDRISSVRRMILAEDEAGRRKALLELLPMQRDDFVGLFEVMNGRPVTIRTLDPPLHEFMPHEKEQITELARTMGVTYEKLAAKVEQLHEMNPMLGHRGCRLAIVYPEILEMQTRAIVEAACIVKAKGIPVEPEIMIPFVSHQIELRKQREVVERVAREVLAERKVELPYLVGTMIELPRAALTADQVAKHAEFFSFGTNDLTQTTFGLSRDDAARFLPFYVDHDILPCDPFVSIDREGVGQLIRWAVEKGRTTRANLKVGICGEHGGDPSSVEFCHDVGFNYVSCSPFRVPIARLAAAQAVLKARKA